MTLIKSANADSIVRTALALDLSDLQKRAAAIIAEAHAEARQIKDDAKREAEKLTSTATEVGFAQGRETGVETGIEEGQAQGRTEAIEAVRTELDALSAQWTESLTEFQAQRNQLHLDAQNDVLALALRLAELLTHRTIDANPELVVDQVAEAMRHIRLPARLRIVLHPGDHALVRDALPNLIDAAQSLDDVDLIEDDNIARGGCRVFADRGSVDARIERQLERITETLLPVPPPGDQP